MKKIFKMIVRVDSSAGGGRRWLCRPVTMLIADQSNLGIRLGCGDACIDWLWSCVGGGAVWLGRRSVWGTLNFPKQTLLCIRWSNSGVIHGRRKFFLLRKETIGATSSRAFKNLFFHSNHMLLIPEHVSSSMWRPSASFSRSAWLLFFHFLAVRIWDLFVWVVLTFKIVVTSTWSVMSRCMTWAVVFLSLLV